MSGCGVPQVGELVESVTTSRPHVAVTFDEPMGKETLGILQSFAEAGMRGTFFTVGNQARNRDKAAYPPALARAARKAGHELGNHSWSHPRLTELQDKGYYQYWLAQRAIRDATGWTPCCARPPYGAVDDGVIRSAGRLKMATVKWSKTASVYQTDPDAIADACLTGVGPGDIILLHQIAPCAAALPLILAGLEAEGLASVRITTLLGGAFHA